MSHSLQHHGLQHARLPFSTPNHWACSNSCPSSQWCHLTISFTVIPFSSCLQSFPASRSFPVSQFFASGGQSIGVSASASVLPMNIQDWFSLGLTGLTSLQSKGLSSFLQHHSSKASILQSSAFFTVQLSYSYMTNLNDSKAFNSSTSLSCSSFLVGEIKTHWRQETVYWVKCVTNLKQPGLLRCTQSVRHPPKAQGQSNAFPWGAMRFEDVF